MFRHLILISVIALSLMLVSLAKTSPATWTDFPGFKEVAESLGINLVNVVGGDEKDYILEANGNGAAFLDYDNDGDEDLLIVNGSTLSRYPSGGDLMAVLYQNIGGRFVDVTSTAQLRSKGWGMGVCIADVDNDGDQDIYVTAYGPNAFYINNGDGTFTEGAKAANIADARWSTNCSFGDFDRDGDVDLYVANYLRFEAAAIPARDESKDCRYMGLDVFCGPKGLPGEPDGLYRNNGDGTFSDAVKQSGIQDPGYYGFGVLFTDVDDDGWPDIYVANDGNPNFLLHNDGRGGFSEVGLVSGTALNESGRRQSGMGISSADFNNDGLLDLFVTNYAGDTNTLYRNAGNLLFLDVTAASGLGEASLPRVGWGTGIEDFDNDGRRDIFVANGHVYPQIDGIDVGQRYLQRKEVYRNLGSGRFDEITSRLGADLMKPASSRGAAFGDFDNDGDIDVLVVNMNARPSLYVNDGGNRRNWITFHLEGTQSNRDAIGARVEIEAGGQRQVAEVQSGGSYLSQNDMRVHFGLGDEERVASVRIRWPNSAVEEIHDVDANRFVTIREGHGIVNVAN